MTVDGKNEERRRWEETLPHVRIEMNPHAVFTRVFVDDKEWAATVRRVSVDIEDGITTVELRFHARVTAEGPLALTPWPVVDVENDPGGLR